MALILFIKSFLKINLLKRSRVKRRDHNLTIIYIYDGLPCSSFFNLIFINNENLAVKDEEQIIAHEKLHYQKLHSLDILLTELLKILFWFNPLIYFYKKSLAKVHEYEVDELATTNETRKNYASLLLNLAHGNSINLTHTFSVQPLSTRINVI